MTAGQVSEATALALHEVGVRREGGVLRMTECELYRTVRSLMHRLDGASSRLDPKRYGYKAVAGAMSELIERRCP